RSGLLTNAALLTTTQLGTGHGPLAKRGLFVAATLLCMPVPGPGPLPVDPAFAQQPAQVQVASRAAVPVCASCHSQFDPYGLPLANHAPSGRYGPAAAPATPVAAHATLPAAAGSGTVANAGELAQALAASRAFTNCMARTLLQYAMVDGNVKVEVPPPYGQA